MTHPNQKFLDAIQEGRVILYCQVGSDDAWEELKPVGPKGAWVSLAMGDGLFEFKLKPRMVKLGNTEVVAPISEALHKQEVHCLEADGTVIPMFYDCTNKEHQRLLLARALFKRSHEAHAFHKAFISLLVYQ